jgi:hypothetical protein
MPEALARFKPGVEIPAFAKTAVTGGRFVKIVDTKTAQGDYQVGQCGAGDRAFGVAQFDSAAATDPANEAARRINVVRAPAVARVQPGAGIDASSGAVAVKSDANGKAIAQGGTGTIVGYALHSCLSTDDWVEVALVF